MTQTTKQLIKKTAGAQIKKRVSAYAEQRVQDTAVSKVSATVRNKATEIAGKTVELAGKAEDKIDTFRKVKRVIVVLLAVFAFLSAVFHKLIGLLGYIPKLKSANDKVATLTGVDIASKIFP